MQGGGGAMNARLASLGRGKRAVVGEALDQLCVYARQFHLLDLNLRIPDRHFNTLIEWADDLGAGDPLPGLDLDVLQTVLPALNAAFLASYSYSAGRTPGAGARGRRVDLVLTDRGGALLVERSRAAACLLAVALHGEKGAVLVAEADQELRAAMDSISEAIARRL
jgi:hypothetical protein